MDFFLKFDFIWFFRELNLRKLRELFSDDSYDKKIDFTIKNRFFTKGGPEPGISSETPWKPRVRRPGSLDRKTLLGQTNWKNQQTRAATSRSLQHLGGLRCG